ncbi:MAG: hypothetical protein KAS61_11730, partial [Spirochaetes bacterium]|nr:hypothetical protein [Spirochaetota bacterium]
MKCLSQFYGSGREKGEPMTPRERVVASLEHREPDKVPIDCGATMCTSLTRGASTNLKEYFQIEKSEDYVT